MGRGLEYDCGTIDVSNVSQECSRSEEDSDSGRATGDSGYATEEGRGRWRAEHKGSSRVPQASSPRGSSYSPVPRNDDAEDDPEDDQDTSEDLEERQELLTEDLLGHLTPSPEPAHTAHSTTRTTRTAHTSHAAHLTAVIVWASLPLLHTTTPPLPSPLPLRISRNGRHAQRWNTSRLSSISSSLTFWCSQGTLECLPADGVYDEKSGVVSWRAVTYFLPLLDFFNSEKEKGKMALQTTATLFLSLCSCEYSSLHFSELPQRAGVLQCSTLRQTSSGTHSHPLSVLSKAAVHLSPDFIFHLFCHWSKAGIYLNLTRPCKYLVYGRLNDSYLSQGSTQKR